MKDYDDYRGAYQGSDRADWYDESIYKKGGFDEFLWDIEKTSLLSILNRSCQSYENIHALDFACGTGRILGKVHVGLYGKNIAVD